MADRCLLIAVCGPPGTFLHRVVILDSAVPNSPAALSCTRASERTLLLSPRYQTEDTFVGPGYRSRSYSLHPYSGNIGRGHGRLPANSRQACGRRRGRLGLHTFSAGPVDLGEAHRAPDADRAEADRVGDGSLGPSGCRNQSSRFHVSSEPIGVRVGMELAWRWTAFRPGTTPKSQSRVCSRSG